MKAEDFNGWLLNRILRVKARRFIPFMQKLKAALISIFCGSPQTRSSGRRDILPFKRLLSETLPLGQVVRGNIAGREAGWVANKLRVVADEIGTLPIGLFAFIACYYLLPISTRLLGNPMKRVMRKSVEKCWHPAMDCAPSVRATLFRKTHCRILINSIGQWLFGANNFGVRAGVSLRPC